MRRTLFNILSPQSTKKFWITGLLVLFLVLSLSPAALAVEGDFNGDGKGDLVWRNENTGLVSIWLMNGKAIHSSGFLGVPLEWTMQGTGDVDKDGKADIVWKHTSGTVAVWLMNGFAITGVGFPGGVSADWVLKGVADVDGDGKADFIWRNQESGIVAVWIMNGTSLASSGFLGGVPPVWVMVGTGDVDGNGKSDILWRNNSTGVVAIWLMDGLSISSVGFPGTAPIEWIVQDVQDLNGNGTADIVWRNTTSREVAVWLMNGISIAESGFLDGAPSEWQVVAIRDVDGDGKGDVIWRNTNSGVVAEWLMNGKTISSVGFPGSTSLDFVSAVPVDQDGDGFTVNQGDCNDKNPAIHPTAVDIPGNGIDENCDGTNEKGPPIEITEPSKDSVFNASPISVRGTITDPDATVEVNGIPAVVNGNTFTATDVPLVEGVNTIVAIATDQGSNQVQASIQVRLLTPPRVSITQPTNLAVLTQNSVEVRGAVDDLAATVVVNGIPASVTNGTFSAAQVPVREGSNIITAVATNQQGTAGTSSIQVVRDTQPPIMTITSPVEGFVTSDVAVTVTGQIHDIVVGTVNSQQAKVTVNGRPAQVANRTFVATGIPLSPGTNQLVAVGEDQGGNQASVQVNVTRADGTGQPQISRMFGDGQTGSIRSPLSNPLVVTLEDGSGNAVAGQTVIFKVVENNGSLAGDAGSVGSGRSLAVTTDAQGKAQAHWTLGSRTGAGNNRVEATAVGFVGKAVFSATGSHGNAFSINPDTELHYVGVVNQPLANPFAVVVSDEGFNPLANQPVTFSVKKGGGHFNGQTFVTVNTDSDGRAMAMLCLGPNEGIENNVIEATFSGNSGLPVTFVASGKPAGAVSQTAVSGVVLDNSNVPIEGVTVTIKDTTLVTQTDAQGQFVLTPVPPGHIHLAADGSTAKRNGTWPRLEFELNAIAGQENTVGMPIFLLPIDVPNGVAVSETTGGTVTLPHVPGFSLTIAPGSAAFPGGGKSGTISVTVVHSDKLPMPPNTGVQPRLPITIQPPGMHFDPPAAITFPNVDELNPGAVTELFSFDHDQGRFVSIGTGTVSEDGRVIQSDPGVGIVKSGWAYPRPRPCPPNCPGGGQNNRVVVRPQQVTILLGQTVEVQAEGSPRGGGTTPVYRWETEDASVISIDSTKTTAGISTASLRKRKEGSTRVKVFYTSGSGNEAMAEVEVVVKSGEVKIDINKTFREDDDVTLIAPAQPIDALVTLQGASGNVQLFVSPPGSALLDKVFLQLDDGESGVVTISPLVKSLVANDVVIIAKLNGIEVGREDMTIAEVKVNAVSFTNGNHLVSPSLNFQKDTNSFIVSAGNSITNPVWIDTSLDGIPEDTDPIAYSRGASPTLEANLNIMPVGTILPDNIRIKASISGPGNLSYGHVRLDSKVMLTTSENIGSAVRKLVSVVSWEYSVDNGNTFASFQSTSHDTFVTLGIPILLPSNAGTIKRLEFAIEATNGAVNDDMAARKTFAKLKDEVGFNLGNGICLIQVWALLDGVFSGEGDCIALAGLMANILNQIGVVASTRTLFASSDLVNDEQKGTFFVDGQERNAVLKFFNGGINAFEGVTAAGGRFYAVNDHHCDQAINVLIPFICPNVVNESNIRNLLADNPSNPGSAIKSRFQGWFFPNVNQSGQPFGDVVPSPLPVPLPFACPAGNQLPLGCEK